MANCECLEGCSYFNTTPVRDIEGMLELRKQKYCFGDNSLCARYRVYQALGPGCVPKDLLPSQIDQARELIEQYTLVEELS